jgi:hypothetical protein
MTVVASNYARKENDLYQTEPWATEALLRHFPICGGELIWEPAAGNHLMADVLRECGVPVVTSDIKEYDSTHSFLFDFLSDEDDGPDATRIITNPPYGKGNRDAVKFAEKALQRCDGLVCLLLTAKFDFGKTRHHLFRDNPRFVAKINLVDRIQWFPGDSSGTEDHAWYVWTGVDCVDFERPTIRYEGKISHSLPAAPAAADTPATTLLLPVAVGQSRADGGAEITMTHENIVGAA